MTRFRRPQGATFIECTVALVILGAAVLSAAQMTIAVMGQQREATQRQLARHEAANLLERLYALPDDQLVQWEADAGPWELSETARQSLPSVAAAATVTRESPTSTDMRLEVEIRWTNAADRPARPVRLVAWRHLTEMLP
jgi:Tfp pilus assembly protein PilV